MGIATVSPLMDAAKLAALKITQRLRVQTDTTGSYTWTFPTPYAPGVIPVVSVTVEDATTNTVWNHQVVAISNTALTIKLNKSQVSVVALIGLSVLSVPAGGAQAFVHLTAIDP